MRRAVVALTVAAATLTGAVIAVLHLGDQRPRSTATVRDSKMGARELADLGLTRDLPVGYQRACRRLAAYAPREVGACPPVVPAGRLKVEVAAPFSRARRHRAGYSMSFASCSLNRYRGRSIETNGCHWAYEVGWSRATRRIVVERVVHDSRNPTNPRSACRWRSLAGQRVRACRVASFEQGGGFHGAHIAYLWERARAAIVLSAHGYLNEARVEAMMTVPIQDAMRRR